MEARVRRYDLMALEPQSTVRLITASKYPPLRGTCFNVGELDYLYTTGYIAALNEFHGMHGAGPVVGSRSHRPGHVERRAPSGGTGADQAQLELRGTRWPVAD